MIGCEFDGREPSAASWNFYIWNFTILNYKNCVSIHNAVKQCLISETLGGLAPEQI